MVKNGDSFVQCFLSFWMLCVCQVFQYLEAQPPVSYIEHTFPPLAFSKLSRGDFEKVPKKSVLVKVNDLWVSDQLVQQYFSIRAKTNPRQYDALIGVTTADWFHSQGSRALREGITEEERDRFSLSSLPCLWDHHCHYHCQHPFALHIYNHQASTVVCDEQLRRTLQRNLSCRAQRVHQLGSGKSHNHPLLESDLISPPL